jgi:hypothetical protein
MYRIVTWTFFLTIGLTGLSASNPLAQAASEIYSSPKFDETRNRINQWLDEQKVSPAIRNQIETIWSAINDSTPADQLLVAAVQSFAIADSRIAGLVEECNTFSGIIVESKAALVKDTQRNEFVRTNLGLYYGRYLVERRLFDEAWDVLKNLDARQAIDPASLFFFRAVAAQGILEVKPALESLDQLLTNTERVPTRYSATAVLMQSDLKSVQAKSLGEIARLMSDSERRLELGRAGERVQEIQERIITDFDEIIKKIEQQQQGGGGGGGGQGGSSNNGGGSPAEDSGIKGDEAPGDVDKKNFEFKGKWGNLNEKDAAKAKNNLNKNFPSHYEQAIDKYTKKMAARTAKKK